MMIDNVFAVVVIILYLYFLGCLRRRFGIVFIGRDDDVFMMMMVVMYFLVPLRFLRSLSLLLVFFHLLLSTFVAFHFFFCLYCHLDFFVNVVVIRLRR